MFFAKYKRKNKGNAILVKAFINNLLIAFMSCFILFNGCYSPAPIPEAVLSKEYKNIKREQHTGLPDNIEILTLETAISIALANNPDYRSAKHAVIAAWARLYSSLSEYMPTISAEYDITEYKYVPLSSGGSGRDQGGNIYSNKTGGLRGRWELFNGLITTMKVLGARKEASQYEALDRDARRILIQNVVYAYNNILLTLEKIRIAKEDMAFNESLLKETEVKYQAGTVPLSEMLNFKVRVNQAKSVLTDENYNLENSKIILAELMGLSEAKLPENIKFSKPEDRKNTLRSIDIYLDSAIANRPDLEAFRKALEVAKFNLWQRYGAFLPTVSANTFWGYSRNDDGYSGRYMYRPRTQDRSFNYGLSIDWIIFSGGSRIADLREAQALLASSKENLYEQWIKVIGEVRIAYENYIRAEEQVKIQRETLELVRKTRDLVEEEYKAGSANLTRLNEAQNDLVAAEGELASSIIALDNAFIQLKSASGEL